MRIGLVTVLAAITGAYLALMYASPETAQSVGIFYIAAVVTGHQILKADHRRHR